METWMILLLISSILGSICPFTSVTGSILSWISMVAKYIFIVLTFFFCPAWWYGLIAIALSLGVTLLIPKVNPAAYGDGARVLSGIGSYLQPVLVLGMYIDLFM